MPPRRPRSALSRSEKKEKAFDLFTRGWTHADIARQLVCDPDTITRYKREYEQSIADQVAANPDLLTDVLTNTVRGLQEIEQLRRAAWDEYEACESDSHVVRNQLLNTVLKISHERNQLFGLFGVKQEYLIHVQRVQAQQASLVGWMQQHLCGPDREALEMFLREQSDMVPVLAIPAEAEEVLLDQQV